MLHRSIYPCLRVFTHAIGIQKDLHCGCNILVNCQIVMENKNKDGDVVEAAAFAAGGAAAGAGVAGAVGGMGLAVGGGAVAIGAAPVIAAGAIVGLAAYGLKKIFS
jgi:hypothetical protein